MIERAVFIRRDEAKKGLPAQLTRDEYEVVCARVGVTALPDDELKRLAGMLEFAQFQSSDTADEETVVHQPIGWRRVAMIQAEKRAATLARAQAVEMVVCERCDAHVRKSLLMASSTHGPVCPDCYAEVG